MTKLAIPSAVLLQHLGILGKTGRGKTTTGKVCIEQVYDEGSRACILDPIKSDWWGITSSADGKRAGLPFYILGGDHGHLPLASSSGKAIADLVAQGQLRHTIIDMANFEPGGQMRWFADFAPRLMQRMKGVLYLVIEEAHLFAPKERAGMGHENMSIHWAKMLATAGRTKGIRLIVLSQRTQAVHNALLGSLDSMIVHGMTAPADMEPVIKWLKANTKDKGLLARIEGSLSGLKTGTGWVCSSEAGIFALQEFPLARTYDNTRTPEDDSELANVKTAPVDLDALRGILGKAAADAEAADPVLLRKRVAELEALLAREKAVIPVSSQEIDGHRRQGMEIGQEAGFRKGYLEALEACRGVADGLFRPIHEALEEAQGNHQARLGALLAALPKAPPHRAARVLTSSIRPAGRILPVPLSMDAQKAIQKHAGLRGKILGALLWLEHRGMSPAPRATVAALAGTEITGGYFKNMMGSLGTENLIMSAQGNVELTEEGRKVAPAPPDYRTMQEAWLAITSGLERRILEVMIEAHPAPLTRVEVATRTGTTADAGYFKNTMGRLSTMGVLTSQKGVVTLSRHVMP